MGVRGGEGGGGGEGKGEGAGPGRLHTCTRGGEEEQ